MRELVVLEPPLLSLPAQSSDAEAIMTTRGTGSLFLFIFAVLVCGGTAAAQGSAMTMVSGAPDGSTAQTRTYYIAADEVTWDYVPGGMDGITGKPFRAVGLFMGGPGPGAKPVEKPVPTSYVKALYREYTDNTFLTLKPRPAEWEHLGFLGPVIRAEVGDTIQVIFRNNGHKPYSIHPHGVFYNKDSEGAPYDDGTSGADKADDACLRAARTSTRGKCQSGPVRGPATSTQ